MMNSILKRTIFLIFVGFIIFTGKSFGQSSPLNIDDFQTYKNTEQREISQFYHTVFKEALLASPFSLPTFPMDITASLSEKITHQEQEKKSSQDSLKVIGSYLRLFLRNSVSSYVLSPVEAAPTSEMTFVSTPVLKNKTTSLSPRLKAGLDYIKPEVSIKNIFNTHLQTNISYHTQEEQLETKLSKQLSKTLAFEFTNTNVFTENRTKKIFFGFSYQF